MYWKARNFSPEYHIIGHELSNKRDIFHIQNIYLQIKKDPAEWRGLLLLFGCAAESAVADFLGIIVYGHTILHKNALYDPGPSFYADNFSFVGIVC